MYQTSDYLKQKLICPKCELRVFQITTCYSDGILRGIEIECQCGQRLGFFPKVEVRHHLELTQYENYPGVPTKITYTLDPIAESAVTYTTKPIKTETTYNTKSVK